MSETALKTKEVGHITDIHQEFSVFGSYILTKSGSLIGAIELGGRDPDGLNKLDHKALSYISRNVYQNIPNDVEITQYYSHFDDALVEFEHRDNEVCNTLSKRREVFLNKKSLTSSRLVYYFEIRPEENLSKLNAVSIAKHLFNAISDKQSRALLKRHFSAQESVICYLEELERQERDLDLLIDDVTAKWGSIGNARQLSLQEMWAHMRFLANLEPELLTLGLHEEVPSSRLDMSLSDGDRAPVSIGGMDALKFKGEESRYARIAAITRFGGDSVTPGMWAANPSSPVRQSANYILMMRFSPLTKLQKSWLFKQSKDELERGQINIFELLKNSNQEAKSDKDKRDSMKPAITAKLEELEDAEMVEDIFGLSHGFVVTFDSDPHKLRDTCGRLKTSLNQAGFSYCWESADIPDAWRTFLPAGRKFSIRDVPFTTSQFAAATLMYKSGEGQRKVESLNWEEAQYVFQTDDGTPFYYSPFVGGKGVVYGIGPIRSGKSFTKTTLATHFQKYGGLFRAVDVDPGAEPLAHCFGDDGKIFRVEGNKAEGFNPFATASGVDDKRFRAHLVNLIKLMLATNDNEDMRQLAPQEQAELDAAISATLRMPKEWQRLQTVVNHCGDNLKMKLKRWVHGDSAHGMDDGMYAHLFDQPVDFMGSIDIPVAAFNLAGVKDDPSVLPLVMVEIFYRITGAFEDPDLRLIPKFMEMDEAHIFLEIDYIADYLVRSVRTWGKWMGGIALWTQNPKELNDLKVWPALRSAASTFFFMADPNMDEGLYRETFKLTPGECDAIRNLIPKKEAYIIQRDIDISKKVILEVEPEQYVVSTSHPREASIFRDHIKNHNFEDAIDLSITDIAKLKQKS